MSKQDGYSSRTAVDLERKYNFGKTFAEVYGLVSDAQKTADEAKSAIDGLNQEQIFNLLTNFGQSQGVYRADNGDVYINASYIKSGKLAADYIDAENLKVSAANITGELVATQINTKDLKVLAANITGTLTAGQIDTTNLKVSAANVTGVLTSNQIDATNLKVSAANVTGTLTADQIDTSRLTVSAANITGSLTANQIKGAEVYLQTDYGYSAGYMSITGANTSSYAIELSSYGALRFNAGYGYAYMESGYGTFLQLGNGSNALGGGNTRPGSDLSFTCGTASYRWTDIYAQNTGIQTSDMNEKKDIVYGLDDYENFFYSLRPVSFLFKDGTSGRRHIGLISQDVEQALADNDLTSLDFAGFIKSPKEDDDGNIVEGEYTYGLRYGELIPMCISQIQKLNRRVKELEELNR